MAGFILHMGATVLCAHGGQVTPTVTNPRVKVGSQPIVTTPAPWMVAGCAFPPPPAGNGPCVTAMWIPPTAAVRVRASGMPVLIQTSQAICAPTGTPVNVVMTQMRVKAT